MESSGFGIIIRVNDLDTCRYFYSRVLGLGEPVFDSPFAAGFRTGSGILCLQKTSAPYLTHGCNAVSLLITSSSADEFEALRQRLRPVWHRMQSRRQPGQGGFSAAATRKAIFF